MPAPLTGSCLCGSVRYAIDAPVTDLRACHCVHCQKASGTGGSVNAVIPSAAFRISAGNPKLYASRAESGRTLNRYFCGDCGSPVYSQRANNGEYVVVRIGTMDNAPPMKITTNIWTRSARPWAWIDPATKQFPGQPDAPPAK
jgi:hypothetical protein